MNTTQDTVKKILNGKSVEEQLEFYKNLYDKVIAFDDYYPRMFPDWDGHFNTNCRLHDEEKGKSFGYNSQMNLWTCWGACQSRGNGSGRVVYYHYLYRKKYEPNFTLMQAMKELYKMFKNSPVDKNNKPNEDYKSLPYPKIYKTSLSLSAESQIIIPTVSGPTIDIEDLMLFTETNSTLSCRIAANFLTKKDKKNTYKDSMKIE